MKVLLLGDCSNVHRTLSQGLQELGVDALVASHGDGWKNFYRDIDITARNKPEMFRLLIKFLFSSQFRGYDVVQFINYVPFLSTEKWSELLKIIISVFKLNNKKLFLGAFGDDYYWVKACQEGVFEYAFFNMYNQKDKIMEEMHGRNSIMDNATAQAEKVNRYFAGKCDGIIAGLYDYWLPYSQTQFAGKLDYIPFPINTKEILYTPNIVTNNKISFLIGIQKGRYQWKGMDLLCPVLEEYASKYPGDMELIYVENCPYKEYVKILKRSNVVVDQVYSMGPAINALTSMALGKVVMSGGEECHYNLSGEQDNKPIINVRPDKSQIRQQVEYILSNRHRIEQWGENSRKYVDNHHDYVQVAGQYLQTWGKNK